MNDLARHTPWLHGVVSHYAGKGVVLFGLLLVGGYLPARSSGRPLGLVAVVAALLMALARVYVGAHFPIDVLAGLAVGAAAAAAAQLLARPLASLLGGLPSRPFAPLLGAPTAGAGATAR